MRSAQRAHACAQALMTSNIRAISANAASGERGPAMRVRTCSRSPDAMNSFPAVLRSFRNCRMTCQ